MNESKAYDHIIDFIVRGMNPNEIINYRPPVTTSERLEILVNKEKEGLISTEEKSELEHYLMIEHIMRLAKAKARKQQRA